ncbi:hypothetical protein QCA50_019363 [Cerrena zonata]|uniref:F-box domain-containing protein n=1 Tax=Cerrena zonata TaxID=2478898 RepID=A0AAW0FEN9_9APHY
MVNLPFAKTKFVYFAKNHAIHRLPNETKSRILRFCDLPTLMGLYCDPDWRELVGVELSLCYNKMLGSFTPDPIAFRKMMASTNAVISGSTALHFLLREPSTWKPQDVDIIAVEAGYDKMLLFILSLPGAQVVSDTLDETGGEEIDSHPYGGLRRLVKVHTNMAKFDVIESVGSIPYNTIIHYWGTHVMNAITADTILCAYPTLTLSQKVVQVRYAATGNPVAKYQERGFHVLDRRLQNLTLSHGCENSVLCSSRNRYFGDEDTLVVAVPGVVARAATDNVNANQGDRVSAWRIGGLACGTTNCYVSSSPRCQELTVMYEDQKHVYDEISVMAMP